MRSVAAAAVVLALSAGAAFAQYDSLGFEGFSLGDMPGQDGWIVDTSGDYGPVQIVLDPTGAGMGNVALFDPPGTAGGWQGVEIDVGPLSGNTVTVEWDQWRADLNDNVWMADDASFGGWWAIQWDTSLGIHAETFGGRVLLTAGVWQHVTYTFDFAGGTVTVDVDGGSAMGTLGDTSIDGWCFEYEPGEFAGEGGPFYVDNFKITQVPTPGALAMIGLGGLAAIRRRR